MIDKIIQIVLIDTMSSRVMYGLSQSGTVYKFNVMNDEKWSICVDSPNIEVKTDMEVQ